MHEKLARLFSHLKLELHGLEGGGGLDGPLAPLLRDITNCNKNPVCTAAEQYFEGNTPGVDTVAAFLRRKLTSSSLSISSYLSAEVLSYLPLKASIVSYVLLYLK